MKTEKILSIDHVDIDHQEGYRIVTTEQNIDLLIDNEQCCCENWGYFFTNDDPKDFIGANLINVVLTDTTLNEAKMKENHLGDEYFEGGLMFVNLETNRGTLQFVLYNEHNGYYGHKAKVVSTQLETTKVL